jgi:Fic family protein
MDRLLAGIAAKKANLDALRPFSQEALRSLQKSYDVELTYTSNAIEGNTLTLRETAEVIEHGITVEQTVRELHRRIVARSQPEIGGAYSTLPRRIAGSAVIFPNPAKVPVLMKDFGEWLEPAAANSENAFDAHFRLVAIHPFADGNGRTARLLMNLLLIRAGYPPVAVRPEDRKAYLDALEKASTRSEMNAFMILMLERLDATLDEYLRFLTA